MLIVKSLLLPKQKSVVKDYSGNEHALLINNVMRLVVWKISGKVWRRQGFQKQLPVLLQRLDENHLLKVMNRPGESGLASVVEKN